jgi:hypothetical protein
MGDRVSPGIDGSPRRGVERASWWSVVAEFYDEDPDIDDRLTAFLAPLLGDAQFVRRLAGDSGAANVDLEFPGQLHFGGVITPAVLRTVADLGLTLGIEIFPNSAT